MEKTSSQRVQLNVERSLIKTTARTSLVVLALILICELVARNKVVQSNIPFQAYGSNHIQFEYQINSLKAFTDEIGSPDCFILGTSMPLRDIDPQVFNATFQDQSGESLLCYNFSVTGATMRSVTRFGEYLLRYYDPRLVIVGTNFLDFTERREEADDSRFTGTAWFRYQVGEWNLEGWLVEHSYAYRLVKLLSYGAYQGLDFTKVEREVEQWKWELTEFGYGYTEKVEALDEPLNPGQIRNFNKQFGDFSISKSNLTALESLIDRIQQNQVTLVVLEMPFHPNLLSQAGDNQRANDFIIEAHTEIQRITQRKGALLLTFPNPNTIPDNGWLDRYHLNANGSPIFSRWLAGQVVEALRAMKITLSGQDQ